MLRTHTHTHTINICIKISKQGRVVFFLLPFQCWLSNWLSKFLLNFKDCKHVLCNQVILMRSNLVYELILKFLNSMSLTVNIVYSAYLATFLTYLLFALTTDYCKLFDNIRKSELFYNQVESEIIPCNHITAAYSV